MNKENWRGEFLPLGAEQGAYFERSLSGGEVLHHQEAGLANICYTIKVGEWSYVTG